MLTKNEVDKLETNLLKSNEELFVPLLSALLDMPEASIKTDFPRHLESAQNLVQQIKEDGTNRELLGAIIQLTEQRNNFKNIIQEMKKVR